MGDYNKNRFRERWLRGELTKSNPIAKKNKTLDEFEDTEKEKKQ